ncbi:MAG: serpin family protein [Polyangiaceae bacterium]
MERSKLRSVVALLIAGSACAGCHGERPDVIPPPADANVPGLLPSKSPSPSPALAASTSVGDASVPSDASAPLAVEPEAESPVAPRRALDAVPPAALGTAVAANNAFAVALFGQVRAGSANANLLTAPISASLALTMAYAGATGQTRSEMARALHFGAAPAQTIFDGQNALSQALLSRGPAAFALASKSYRGSKAPAVATDYELQVVNSVWGEASYSWESPFLHTLAADYGASVYKRDFRTQAEATRQAINAWVSKQTSNKINHLLSKEAVSPDTRLVLVNALHLKLPWETPFRKGATSAAPFTRADKTQVSTQFMNTSEELAYVDDGSAQIVSLPLAGRQLSVLIALPHAGSSLEAYERSLRAGSAALLQPKKNARVILSLPKSAFTSQAFSLKAALQALGMKQAFEAGDAHFEGMCAHPPDDRRLFVDDIVQKTMIDVQETGVEAAAATAVVMATMGAVRRRPEPAPVPMIVNRPYLIALLDVPTGAILMLGHITDPSQPATN